VKVEEEIMVMYSKSRNTWSHPILENVSSGTQEVFFSFFKFLLFYYSYVHTMLGSFLPLPPLPYHPLCPLPHLTTPSIPGRNYFALISTFVEERV
jgi:hypothetical protein